jgi:hypothetical protein
MYISLDNICRPIYPKCQRRIELEIQLWKSKNLLHMDYRFQLIQLAFIWINNYNLTKKEKHESTRMQGVSLCSLG